MKKSNLILFGIAVLASVFLLWIWYFLGLNRIDEPLDLILSIVWWALIAVLAVAIWRVEVARRKRIRTVLVGDNALYNSEKGFMSYMDREQLMGSIGRILRSLDYNFEKQDLPDKNRFNVKYLIRSDNYDDNTWSGEVVLAGSKEERQFANEEELRDIISKL